MIGEGEWRALVILGDTGTIVVSLLNWTIWGGGGVISNYFGGLETKPYDWSQ